MSPTLSNNPLIWLMQKNSPISCMKGSLVERIYAEPTSNPQGQSIRLNFRSYSLYYCESIYTVVSRSASVVRCYSMHEIQPIATPEWSLWRITPLLSAAGACIRYISTLSAKLVKLVGSYLLYLHNLVSSFWIVSCHYAPGVCRGGWHACVSRCKYFGMDERFPSKHPLIIYPEYGGSRFAMIIPCRVSCASPVGHVLMQVLEKRRRIRATQFWR